MNSSATVSRIVTPGRVMELTGFDRAGFDPMPGRYQVGDRMVVTYHRRYEPGTIEHVMSIREEHGDMPFYRIDFGRYKLHLTADEIVPNPGEPAP